MTKFKTNGIKKKSNKAVHSSSPKINKAKSGSSSASTSGKYSTLQEKFKKKLEGARFRSLNEELYTCTGAKAFENFQKDNHLFEVVSALELMFYKLLTSHHSIMKDFANKLFIGLKIL